MKPIVLNDKEKETLIAKFVQEFVKSLNDYTFSGEKEFSFKTSIKQKLKEKIQIVYSPIAYLRMEQLVGDFDSEISWFGLVKQLEPKKYYVYDVLIPKQQVSGAKVDTKDEDMLEFICNLTDEQAEFMHFQAHSHVNFGTEASGTDLQNQEDILSGMPGNEGFYIFQIWNKKGSINTYLYNLDENMFYDKDDIELAVEDPTYGTLDDFTDAAAEKVEKIVYKPAQTNYKYSNYYYPNYNQNAYLNGVPDYDSYDKKEYEDFLDEFGKEF